MITITIGPHEHGFAWSLHVNGEEMAAGTAPAEHICMLEAREVFKRSFPNGTS